MLEQRFGSALNLNIHQHMIALEGVYAVGKSGNAKFQRVKAPNQTELQTLLNRVIQRVVRRLEKEGLLIPDPEQPWLALDFHEPLDSLSAASNETSNRRYRIAIGPHSGSRRLLHYMTHYLSEQTKLLNSLLLIKMAFRSMPPCHVSPINGID
jgi:hypothetical protein